jgi:cytochrome P450
MQKNNALVWTETVRILQERFVEWDASTLANGTKHITLDIIKDITLFVIASAGFGIQFSKATVDAVQPGHSMPFGKSIFIVVETLFVRIFVPRWLYRLPIKSLHESDEAFSNIRAYIDEMIREARESRQEAAIGDAVDLFRRLLAANETDEMSRLTDDELVSNIYVGLK